MKHLLFSFCIVSLLAACSLERSAIPSYKLSVPQGNVLDKRAVNALSVGMTANQVRSMLGTPQLQDPFHQNRWDYPFVVTRNGKIRQQANLTLHFDQNGILKKIEGDAVEAAKE
ncbi:MAG: outer membrane protein assembly factor BamE [Neisseriaceae bacterium]|nr:outer membrane protein assembly factor BamE [Neisseriaceae bacterium]